MSRLAAFTASVAAASAACEEYLPTFARFWQGQVRRMSRDAIRNFQRVQPVGVVAAVEPPFFLPQDDEVLHLPTERAIISAAVAKHWDAISALLMEMGAESGISFAVRNRLVREVLTDRGQHITSIVETTRREVMRELQDAYDLGESIPKASRRVARVMGGVSKYRATMIASTEMIGAVNGASLRLASVISGTSLNDDGSVRSDTLGHDPLRLFKTWYATMDQRTRPAHAQANGQTVPLNEFFSVGGSSMQFPGDPAGPGDQVIHCRCTMTYSEQAGGLLAPGGRLAQTPTAAPLGVSEPVSAPERVTADATQHMRAQGIHAPDGKEPPIRWTDDGLQAGTLGHYDGVNGITLNQRELASALDNLPAGRREVEAGFQSVLHHEYGHHIDEVLTYETEHKAVVSAMRESRLLKGLDLDDPVDRWDEPIDRVGYARYLQRERELFARAFAQYVAKHSGDRALIEEIAHNRAQWNADDFEAIDAAMETLLRRHGWLT